MVAVHLSFFSFVLRDGLCDVCLFVVRRSVNAPFGEVLRVRDRSAN